MEKDSIYIVHKDGSVFTDIPSAELEMKKDGFYMSYFDSDEYEYESVLKYDEIYAIGKITEDGCEVLWKE
jgi:hypothetical protein